MFRLEVFTPDRETTKLCLHKNLVNFITYGWINVGALTLLLCYSSVSAESQLFLPMSAVLSHCILHVCQCPASVSLCLFLSATLYALITWKVEVEWLYTCKWLCQSMCLPLSALALSLSVCACLTLSLATQSLSIALSVRLCVKFQWQINILMKMLLEVGMQTKCADEEEKRRRQKSNFSHDLMHPCPLHKLSTLPGDSADQGCWEQLVISNSITHRCFLVKNFNYSIAKTDHRN